MADRIADRLPARTRRLVSCLGLGAAMLSGTPVLAAYGDGLPNGQHSTASSAPEGIQIAQRDRGRDNHRREEHYYRRPDVYYTAPPVVYEPPVYYQRPGVSLNLSLPLFR